MPTRSRFVCLPECPFVSHTHIIGHDPLYYPKSQWLKMHSCRLIQERKIFPPKSSRIVTSNTQHPRSLYSDDVRPHNKRTRARMHPCTHALATHKHTRTQHTSTQARTQSTQPATDGTHSRLIFCSPARQLRDGAKAVAAAGCRLLSLRNKKAHEIALSKKMKTENWRVGDKKDRAGSKPTQEESKFWGSWSCAWERICAVRDSMWVASPQYCRNKRRA